MHIQSQGNVCGMCEGQDIVEMRFSLNTLSSCFQYGIICHEGRYSRSVGSHSAHCFSKKRSSTWITQEMKRLEFDSCFCRDLSLYHYSDHTGSGSTSLLCNTTVCTLIWGTSTVLCNATLFVLAQGMTTLLCNG
jgi:hypothetical protein